MCRLQISVITNICKRIFVAFGRIGTWSLFLALPPETMPEMVEISGSSEKMLSISYISKNDILTFAILRDRRTMSQEVAMKHWYLLFEHFFNRKI
jgi:hypothetical protein